MTAVALEPVRQVAPQSPRSVSLDQFVYRESRSYRRMRRALDLALATLLLPAVVPAVAFAALAIKIEDGGPVFFIQKRVGRFGKLFDIYKLRTMRMAACGDEPSPTGANDSRVTAVGRYLRKLSIDELPQLINVFRGDMALVGPRPELPFRVPQYEAHWQQLKFIVTPGITGLWQVKSRATIANHEPAATVLDLEYASKASTLVDLLILGKTVQTIISPRGVY